MKPFALEPVCKNYIWGGGRLRGEWGINADFDTIAEAWMLSAHPDGRCIAAGGPLRGMTLDEIVRGEPQIVSQDFDAASAFPLMVKLIDSADPLSIQVHPDDDYARRIGDGAGKTEMWYIIDHEPGARVCIGFARQVGRDEVEGRIADGTLADVLRFIEVKRGDCLFIPAGTIHSIGRGLLIAEVQQSSNTTYRVFDYGRLGADGRPRTLHVERALDVLSFSPAVITPPGAGAPRDVAGGTLTQLAECSFFRAHILELNGTFECDMRGTFMSALCLSGSAMLTADGGSSPLRTGTSVFVPAGGGTARIEGRGKFLLSSPGSR